MAEMMIFSSGDGSEGILTDAAGGLVLPALLAALLQFRPAAPAPALAPTSPRLVPTAHEPRALDVVHRGLG